MKYQYIRLLVLTMALGGWLASCKKESANIFNMFDVTLDLHSGNPNAASEYNEASPGDTLSIDFTINSPTKDMYMICVLKVGSNTPFIKIPITDEGKRRTYSDIVKVVADKAGETSYRVWALDEEGVYLGDGYKKITIHVASDYKYLSNRRVFFPDTTGKSMNCYLSLETGETWNYSNGESNSDKIDLGIYRVNQYNSSGDHTGYKWYVYSLSADPSPFTPYDISGWTKRATLFASPQGNANEFRDKLATGLYIETEAKKKTIDKKLVEVSVNKYIYFKTPEGKYGALMIVAFTDDYLERPFVNVGIKILP